MKKIKKFKSRNNKGFSLIEIMVVIVLIGALLYFIAPNIPIVRDFIEKKNLVDTTNAVYAAASEYAPQGDWSQVTTANLLASGVLKEYHNSADSAILNPNGSPITFTSADIGTGSDNAVLITQSDMKDRPCNLFVTGYWKTAELINVNTVPVKTASDQAVQTALINANCTNNNNVVAITRR
jgi:prepilin-type N-terminal cleavage/methylation domain-containing protein